LERFAEQYFGHNVELSPVTSDLPAAKHWLRSGGGPLDGVIAKRIDLPYESGQRTGMVKVKNLRTADCVVGGFRYAEKAREVGSLLLGLYDEEGLLNQVGFCSGVKAADKKGSHRPSGKTHRAARLHGPRARRSQPLIHRAFSTMGTAET
jgi:ATP-dependent DNA ligase